MESTLLLFLFLLPISVNSRGTVECHHSIEGSCKTEDGFCYHNTKTGEFNCDERGFCASKIQGTKQAGCFNEGNSTTNDHCCCNKGDGCSIGFANMRGQPKTTTRCTSNIQMAGRNEQAFNECEDPFCYTYLSLDERYKTSVWRGCMATQYVRYNMYRAEDRMYQNNSKWKELHYLVGLPRCEDIVSDEEYRNGTGSSHVAKCMEYESDDRGKMRFCCCKGKSNCNADFGWHSPAISLDEAYANKRIRVPWNGSMAGLFSLPTLSLLIFSIFN